MIAGISFPSAIDEPEFWPPEGDELFGGHSDDWPVWTEIMDQGVARRMLAAAALGSRFGCTVHARSCHIYAATAVLESFSDRVPDSETWFRSALGLGRMVVIESPVDEGVIYETRHACQERLARSTSPPSDVDCVAGVAYHLALLCAHHRSHPRIAISFAQGLIDYALMVHAAGLRGPARQAAMTAANVEIAADLFNILQVLPGSAADSGETGELSLDESSDLDQIESLAASQPLEVTER